MAPAVCILNPSNGTHNCRPGGGLRWVRSPTAAHRSKHALARSSNHAPACHASGPHWEGASSISRGGALAQRRGFGTCGWKGVGTPNIRSNSARGILRRNGTGHPEWVRCHGPRAGRRFPPRLRKGGAASVLGRLGNPSSRSWRSEYPLLAQDGEAGPRAGLSRPGQPRRQSDGSRSTVSAVP